MSKKKEKESGHSEEKLEKKEKKEKAKRTKPEIVKTSGGVEEGLEAGGGEKPQKEKKAKRAEKKEKPAAPSVELKFIVDGKNEIEVLLEGVDLGLANLLVEKLLENKNVEFASADYAHPTQRTPLLKIKAKGSVRKAVADALKEIEKEIKALGL